MSGNNLAMVLVSDLRNEEQLSRLVSDCLTWNCYQNLLAVRFWQDVEYQEKNSRETRNDKEKRTTEILKPGAWL